MIFDKKRFRELREAAGLTLEEIAIACDVAKSTVQKWEKHPVLQPRPRRIAKIAEVLRCEKTDLVRYGDAEAPNRAGIVAALEHLLSELKRYAEKNKEQKQND